MATTEATHVIHLFTITLIDFRYLQIAFYSLTMNTCCTRLGL